MFIYFLEYFAEHGTGGVLIGNLESDLASEFPLVFDSTEDVNQFLCAFRDLQIVTPLEPPVSGQVMVHSDRASHLLNLVEKWKGRSE